MTIRTRALFLAGLMVAVSCSDAGNPVGPGETPLPPRSALQALECSVELATRQMLCAVPQPGSGSALGSEQITVGGQNLYVTLAATSITVADDTIQLDVTVRNLIPQALGVDSVGDPHPDGVRVFFSAGPLERPSNAGATLLNEDGTAMFFVGSRPYFQYDTVLETGETSAARPWRIQFSPGSTSVYFTVYVAAHVRYPKGWIDISPDSVLMEVDSVRELTAVVRDFVGRDINETITWTSSAPGVASVAALTDSTAEVTGVSQGTAWIRAVSDAEPVRRDSILVTVDDTPTLVVDSIGALSNVTMPVDSANGMLANDSDDGLLRVIADSVGTAKGGSAWLNEDGSFEYLSPAGFAGRDSIHYQVSDGVRTLPGLAVVDVDASRYWFVRAGGTGDGRDRAPLGSVAAAVDSAAVGDTIFVLAAGATELDGTWTLENDQAIVGQGIAADFQRGPYNGAMVTVLEAGISPWLSSGGATGTLAQGNSITGVSITSTAGAALTGTGFGTLTLRRTVLSPTGPALLLSTGTVDVDASVTVSSSGSAGTGFSLTAVDGTFAPGAGSIGGAAGAAVHVSGGGVEVTYAGDITNSAGRSVHVTGRTGGGVTLSGSITDTGTGILVDANSGGTVAFTGASKSISTGTAAAVTLTSNAGMSVLFSGGGTDLSTTTGTALAASGGGTLEVTGTGNDVTTTTGAALAMNGVEVGASGIAFATVNTGAAAAPVSLVDVTSTGAITVSGGTIAAGPGVRFAVSGGDVDVTWAGALQQSGNAFSLVSVAGSHAGALTFSGNLSAASGDGLQFNAADGTYAFSGTTELNGGDAGVDITNGSAGTFTFGTGTAITSPSGTAFNVYGSSPTVTYSGNLTKGNAGAMVEVGEQPGGSVTFQTGTLSAGAGSGISLSNADGTVAFNGTTTLSGGPTIAVVGGSAGTISFASGASVTNPAGSALLVSASAPALTYAGSISSNAARPVQIEGMTGGSVAVSGSVTGTGNGILVQNNNTGSAKTITFSGAVNLSTGANEAVTLANNTGATIGFTSGATDLTTTTGNAFAATGGGTVNLSGGSNDISTSTGSALLLNGVTLGASGMSLATLNVTGAAVAPVVLTSVGVTTGSGITVSGGSIAAGAGTRLAVSGGTVNVSWAGSISQSTHNASLLSVAGGHATGTLAFSGTLSATQWQRSPVQQRRRHLQLHGHHHAERRGRGRRHHQPLERDLLVRIGNQHLQPDRHGVRRERRLAHHHLRRDHHPEQRPRGVAGQHGRLRHLQRQHHGERRLGHRDLGDEQQRQRDLQRRLQVALHAGERGGHAHQQQRQHPVQRRRTGAHDHLGCGLNATGGGGTLQVTGANNTISSGTGIALSVQNVNIGASGLTFQSISHSGGANGIMLVNTGATNGLQVTGTGTVGSGGSIINTTGGDGATSGNGVYLNNARNISLNWMGFSGHANNGLFGIGVRGLSMNKVRFTGNNGTSNSGTYDESAGAPGERGRSREDHQLAPRRGRLQRDAESRTSPVPRPRSTRWCSRTTPSSHAGEHGGFRGSGLLVNLSDGTADTSASATTGHRTGGPTASTCWCRGRRRGPRASPTTSWTTRTVRWRARAASGWQGATCTSTSPGTASATPTAPRSADKVNFGTTIQGTIASNTIGVSGVPNSGSVRASASSRATGPGDDHHREHQQQHASPDQRFGERGDHHGGWRRVAFGDDRDAQRHHQREQHPGIGHDSEQRPARDPGHPRRAPAPVRPTIRTSAATTC
jgi:hypothetical protein